MYTDVLAKWTVPPLPKKLTATKLKNLQWKEKISTENTKEALQAWTGLTIDESQKSALKKQQNK